MYKPIYELTIIFAPVSEARLEELKESYRRIIENGSGTIISFKSQKKDFAKPIKGFRKGIIASMHFPAPPATANSLYNHLMGEKEIITFGLETIK